MLIEIIGCTSAGKSTQARSIFQACRGQGIDIFLGDDFVLRQIRLQWIKINLLRKLLVNLFALFVSLLTWRNNLEFYAFATQFVFQLPIAWLEKLGLLRNVLKKIGIYEIIRLRSTDQQIILEDEGVLHAAHHLFVHCSIQVKAEHLATFIKLIPLPDVIVYLRQPESLLIDRTMKRGHKRIPVGSYSDVARFIKNAVATFDKLAQYPAVESKLLLVNVNGGQNVDIVAPDQDDPLVRKALKIIQNEMTAGIHKSPKPVHDQQYPGFNQRRKSPTLT